MAFELDFIAVGPQRTGTSWLDAALRHHPQASLPRQVKETFYFENNLDKGVEWYAGHFAARAPGQVVGEIAPTLLDLADGPERVHALSPGCKVIVTLREPASRAVSLYRLHLNKGRVRGDFRSAVARMPRILDAGHYARHVPRWLERFGKERTLVLLLDDIETKPQETLDRVCAFLGIASMPLPTISDERVGSTKRAPRFPMLAKVAASAATRLRARGLHGVVELGKQLGLKRAVFAGSAPAQGVSRDDVALLRRTYADDIAFVRRLTGRPLEGWEELRVDP